MTTANAAPAMPDSAEETVEGLPPGFGTGFMGRLAFGIAIAFALFQLWTAAYGTLPSQVVRAMHVGFLLLLGFGLVGNLVAKTLWGKVFFWSLAVLGFMTGLYNWVFYADLLKRSSFLTPVDLAVGTVVIVLVFEAARRLMGVPLAIISGIFLAYCFFGQYMPGAFVHRGYDFAQIVEHFGFGTEGIYGTPIYVSAAYIFIFVVFAAFLERAGMIALFNDFALGLVGGLRGGPAGNGRDPGEVIAPPPPRPRPPGPARRGAIRCSPPIPCRRRPAGRARGRPREPRPRRCATAARPGRHVAAVRLPPRPRAWAHRPAPGRGARSARPVRPGRRTPAPAHRPCRAAAR